MSSFTRYTFYHGFTPMLFGKHLKMVLQDLLVYSERHIEAIVVSEFDDGKEHAWNDTIAATLSSSGEAVLKLTSITDSANMAKKTFKRIIDTMTLMIDEHAGAAKQTKDISPNGTYEEIALIQKIFEGKDVSSEYSESELRELTGESKSNPMKAAVSNAVTDECKRLTEEMNAKIAELEQQIEATKKEYAEKIAKLQERI